MAKLMIPEFTKFSKIEHFKNLNCQITQKIHGTNAQIYIDGDQIVAGSRTQWLINGLDNYGFAAFVREHAADLIRILGEGRHYGEWAGPGINSGEGLSEKTLCLFSHGRYKELMPRVVMVPIIYAGTYTPQAVEESMALLKEHGSRLVPGFMRPEGIVINLQGTRYKRVFEPEDTQWTKSSGVKNTKENTPHTDYSHLCQPIRLEKLLSRDERYLTGFPKNLPEIVHDYVADLKEEGAEFDAKDAATTLFRFIRLSIQDRG